MQNALLDSIAYLIQYREDFAFGNQGFWKGFQLARACVAASKSQADVLGVLNIYGVKGVLGVSASGDHDPQEVLERIRGLFGTETYQQLVALGCQVQNTIPEK